jgi:hypothetical protein
VGENDPQPRRRAGEFERREKGDAVGIWSEGRAWLTGKRGEARATSVTPSSRCSKSSRSYWPRAVCIGGRN